MKPANSNRKPPAAVTRIMDGDLYLYSCAMREDPEDFHPGDPYRDFIVLTQKKFLSSTSGNFKPLRNCLDLRAVSIHEGSSFRLAFMLKRVI